LIVRAIITAAGDSRRMGRPKALLEIAGESVMARLFRVLTEGGVDQVLLVQGGRHSEELIAEAQRVGLNQVENPDPSRGPISSILTGMNCPGDWDLLLIQPLDVVGVHAGDISKLLNSARENKQYDAWVMSHDMRRGHPVLIRKKAVLQLGEVEGPPHLRALLAKEESRIYHVVTENHLVLEDVDDEEDWLRIRSQI